MKKILFLLIVFISCSANAQNKCGIYYNSDKIGYSRIVGKKVGNIAGAYFTLGLSAANSNKVIEGESAETKIKETKPVFTVHFGDDQQTGYLFTNPANIDNILLLKLYKKKKSRNLRTGKYGLTGVKTGVDEKDIQPLHIEKLDDNSYQIYPREELEKGEYAFYYIGDIPEGKDPFNGVFDFSVKKK